MDKQFQKTAKIYAFPVRKTPTSKAKLAQMEVEARRFKAVEFGTGWYHDAAIAETNPRLKS